MGLSSLSFCQRVSVGSVGFSLPWSAHWLFMIFFRVIEHMLTNQWLSFPTSSMAAGRYRSKSTCPRPFHRRPYLL
jgi:hypothetical protein